MTVNQPGARGATGATGANLDADIPLEDHFKQRGERFTPADVVDKIKPFERAAAAPRFSWFAPAGALLVGAGIGGLFAGRGLHTTAVLLTLVPGAMLIAFGAMWGRRNAVDLEALCGDLAEWLDRWHVMEKPMSPQYQLLVDARTKRHEQGFWKRLWWVITR